MYGAYQYAKRETMKTDFSRKYIIVKGKRIYEHRYVMQKKLGRKLKQGEFVHHIDGNQKNNAPENLEIYTSQSEHMKKHLLLKNYEGRKTRPHIRFPSDKSKLL